MLVLVPRRHDQAVAATPVEPLAIYDGVAVAAVYMVNGDMCMTVGLRMLFRT